MAADANYADWIPEELGGPVITAVDQGSVVERLATRVPMTTLTREVPRSGGMDVEVTSKSTAYGEDTSGGDTVILTARKITKALRLADEDLNDIAQVANIIETKKADWARSYAKFIDNSCFAVTQAENGTTRPFTSVYRALRSTNTDTAYVADDNYLATGGDLTYDDMSDLAALIEDSDYFDETRAGFVGSPAFKKLVRGIKDSHGDPIFTSIGPWPTGGTGPTLLDLPIYWSIGCKTSASASSSPTGNPLLFVANFDYLNLGIRSGPESRVADADSGVGWLTDDALMKIRARRGFAVGHEKAFGVLEKTDSGS
jgi:HK97 family phage major capsid protein